MSEADTQTRVMRLLADIHGAESLAAKCKNELIAMGYQAGYVEAALRERSHTYFCNAGTMMGSKICTCPKPEIAFTEEVF